MESAAMNRMIRTLKPCLPRPAISLAREMRYRSKAACCLYQAAIEAVAPRMIAPGIPAPPPRLRLRVHGNSSLSDFIATGKTIASNVSGILQAENFMPGEVLDFGCGCGRVITYLHGPFPAEYTGVDVDSEVIEWSKRNVRFAKFAVGPPLPPLPFADGAFDLIFTISVFSHLDEHHCGLWAKELTRLLSPSGLLLITTIGRPYFPPEMAGEFRFFPAQKTSWFAANRCEWYGTTCMTAQYAASFFSGLRPVRHVEQGINHHQDAILFRH
jgi:SAM-dependent methyltransferase